MEGKTRDTDEVYLYFKRFREIGFDVCMPNVEKVVVDVGEYMSGVGGWITRLRHLGNLRARIAGSFACVVCRLIASSISPINHAGLLSMYIFTRTQGVIRVVISVSGPSAFKKKVQQYLTIRTEKAFTPRLISGGEVS